MNRHVCIHAHFYQPPRENPWLEEIEVQDSAYPYHDWNDRITAECYAPNTASRILDSSGKIIKLVDNYSMISFNIGPTLLSWLNDHAPDIYQAIINADKESQKRFSGHGSAIAQVYNHMIMPLSNARDRRTQVVWGIRDFERRFGRKPEGMWLPETAVDIQTLDIMAEQGIKFTILAPHQAKSFRKLGEKKWSDATGGKIDPKMPYLLSLPSGRKISLFFYDGPVAHDVSFGGLLKSGENFANRLVGLFSKDQKEPQIAHIATDGETYGHHFRFGDMALSYCLHHIESKDIAKITIYGEYLEKYPPTHEVQIYENTSWSCSHGVDRWKRDCGDNTGGHPGWNQKWREPLRNAMDWLRDSLIQIYEKELGQYFKDPWLARDEYIDIILDRSAGNVERFVSKHAARNLSGDEKIKVIKLLELQRHAMLMYASCGWFFDEISGIETVQTLQYAARAIQLAKEVNGADLETNFLKILEAAQSNIREFGNGARVYELFVKTSLLDMARVAAHYAVSSLFEDYPEKTKIYSFTAVKEMYDRVEAGLQRLAFGRVRLRSEVTGEESCACFASLNFGGHNVLGGVHEFMGDQEFSKMLEEIKKIFTKGDITEMIHFMDDHFGVHNYSLWHLFRDEQRKVLDILIESTLKDIETLFRQIYEHHYPVMQVMKESRIPLPKAIEVPVDFVINTDLRKSLEEKNLDLDRIQRLVGEVKRWSFETDKVTLAYIAGKRIDEMMENFSQKPEDATMLEKVEDLLKILSDLSLDLNLWKSQNIYFQTWTKVFGGMKQKAEKGDENAKRWVEQFLGLGNYLRLKVV